MIGYDPGRFWKWSWFFFTPFLCVSVALYSLIKYEPFRYKNYVYPWWGELIGWMIALSSMLVIPFYAVYKITVTPGTWREVNSLFYLLIINQVKPLLCFKRIIPQCDINDFRRDQNGNQAQHLELENML
jgi:hypothetical protein